MFIALGLALAAALACSAGTYAYLDAKQHDRRAVADPHPVREIVLAHEFAHRAP